MKHQVVLIKCGITNCYVLNGSNGSIIIDNGISTNEAQFLKNLNDSVKQIDNIRLMVLTHGHYDHAGNTAILRKKYGLKVAMHPGDLNFVRNAINDFPAPCNLIGSMIRKSSLRQHSNLVWEGFEPDILLEDGQTLEEYGIDAKIHHLPGHTEGSIGILTSSGDLFAGDVVMNIVKPGISIFAHDEQKLKSSFNSLKKYKINTVYPGHGNPFNAHRLIK